MRCLNYKSNPFPILLLLLFGLHIIIFIFSPYKSFFTGEDFQWLTMIECHHFNFEEKFLFRPLLRFYFLITTKFLKIPILYFHIINHLFHFIGAVLLMFFIYKLTKKYFLSFLTSFIFSIHYINTNVTFTIRRIDEILATIFSLCSLIFFLNFMQKKKKVYYISSIFTMILAFLSRETSIILPILLLTLCFIYSPGKVKTKTNQILPFLFIAFIFSTIRICVPPSPSLEKERIKVLMEENYYRLALLAVGLQLLFIPFDFQGDEVDFLYLWQHNMLIAWLIVFIYLSLIFIIKNRHYRFSLIWTGIALIPALFYPDSIMREKYLYSPLTGTAFFLSLIISDIINSLRFRKIYYSLFIIGFLIISSTSRLERKKDFIEVSETVKNTIQFLNTKVISPGPSIIYIINHRYYINRFATFPGSWAHLFAYARSIPRYYWPKVPIFINIEFPPDEELSLERIKSLLFYIFTTSRSKKKILLSEKIRDIFYTDCPFVFPGDNCLYGIDSLFPSSWKRYIFYFDPTQLRLVDLSFFINLLTKD